MSLGGMTEIELRKDSRMGQIIVRIFSYLHYTKSRVT
jgi:hypothetical protein